jgi:hypothetical protein
MLILQDNQQNTPLLICASSAFLLQVLVKERNKYENDMLDPNFRLLKATFKKVAENLAKISSDEPIQTVEIDPETDLMFESPGMVLLYACCAHRGQATWLICK